jgi:medium-chain acyl-[acyl-carrier-protein] hydrolase
MLYSFPAKEEPMGRVHTQVYTVRNYELGPYQAAHVRTLLDYLGETADSHIKELGVSIQDLLEKDLLWVLVGYHLRIDRYPLAGEKITVNTWYPGRLERFYLRDFEVYGDGPGADREADRILIAAATTSWALIDAVKRRPVASDDALPNIPVLDKRAVEEGIEHIPPADSPQTGDPFTVPSSCLDMYRHVNHAFYVQWALDSVVPGIEKGILPFSIEAVFKGEAVAGNRLAVALQATEEEGTWLHSIIREDDGKEVTRLRTKWK